MQQYEGGNAYSGRLSEQKKLLNSLCHLVQVLYVSSWHSDWHNGTHNRSLIHLSLHASPPLLTHIHVHLRASSCCCRCQPVYSRTMATCCPDSTNKPDFPLKRIPQPKWWQPCCLYCAVLSVQLLYCTLTNNIWRVTGLISSLGKAKDHWTSGLRECDPAEEDPDHQRCSARHVAVPHWWLPGKIWIVIDSCWLKVLYVHVNANMCILCLPDHSQ